MRRSRKYRGLVLIAGALFGAPGCGCGGGGPGGDALMLSNNTQVSLSPQGVWEFGAVGVTVNVIKATSGTSAGFEELDSNTLLYQGVTSFESQEGPATITLSTSLQTATATFNAATSRYDISGLSGAGVYAAPDALNISAEGISFAVQAPDEVGSAAELLGDPNGFRTQVSLPDGGFDYLYVFMPLSGGSGGGEAGIIRLVPAEEMQVENGRRVAPMLDDNSIATLEDLGLTPSTIYVAAYRQIFDTALFGSEIPVQAGRMFQINPAALNGSPPTAN